MPHPSFFSIAQLVAVLVLAVSASGCVATVPAMLAYSYATTGAFLGMSAAQTGIAYKQADIAQQNADTYRQSVQQAAASDAPQCADATVRANCPLYQYRAGLYRAKCQDGSGVEVGPGYVQVLPPPMELPHPWQAEGCTMASAGSQ